MASRWRGDMPQVSSCRARACSRGVRMPHWAKRAFTLEGSTRPVPPLLTMLLSGMGPLGSPPPGCGPPLGGPPLGGPAAGGPAASRDLAAAMVLQLLDQFVEPEDDLFLQLLGLGSALGAVETLADDVHLAGDGGEVLVLPGLDVEQHEGGDSAVALGSADAVLEQPDEGARRVFALERGMLAHGPCEEIRGRRHDLSGPNRLENEQGLVMPAAEGEGPRVRQAEVAPEERRALLQ